MDMNNDRHSNEQNLAQTIAEKVSAAMYARDRASQALGIELDSIAPGFARARMTIREDMVNGHNISIAP